MSQNLKKSRDPEHAH